MTGRKAPRAATSRATVKRAAAQRADPPTTPGMAIPTGRQMPREVRLTPPTHEAGRTGPPNGDAFHTIGKRNRKVEGLAKVTGRAIYADDLALPRMLHAKLLRSIHAHARILRIDASEALAMPGEIGRAHV